MNEWAWMCSRKPYENQQWSCWSWSLSTCILNQHFTKFYIALSLSLWNLPIYTGFCLHFNLPSPLKASPSFHSCTTWIIWLFYYIPSSRITSPSVLAHNFPLSYFTLFTSSCMKGREITFLPSNGSRCPCTSFCPPPSLLLKSIMSINTPLPSIYPGSIWEIETLTMIPENKCQRHRHATYNMPMTSLYYSAWIVFMSRLNTSSNELRLDVPAPLAESLEEQWDLFKGWKEAQRILRVLCNYFMLILLIKDNVYNWDA